MAHFRIARRNMDEENRGKVYVGRVKENTPYYHVKKESEGDFIKGTIGENIAPHRIKVSWLYNQGFFDADFSTWQDTVHEVSKGDLRKTKDRGIRSFFWNLNCPKR